nr:EAL domain-containing protein [Hungatella hominis]
MLCIIWNYSRQSHSLPTLKNKLFQVCFLTTFLAMTSNILSTICIQNTGVIPLWVNWPVTTIYFIATPLMGVIYFYYALSILYENQPRFPKRWLFLLLPAVFYLLLVISNPFTGSLFSLSLETRYEQGPLIITTYLVFYIYCLFTCVTVVALGKRVDPTIRNILACFPLIAALVVIIQQIFPEVILSGSAATCALLILYLYLQNKQISIDYLLGIPNHKEFLNSLQLQIKRHKDASFTILLVSLRNFKQVNDTYGQQNGDEFLKTVCNYLSNTVKPYQLYRYNGDEFAVLIPESDKETIIRLVKAIDGRFNQPWKSRDFRCMIGTVIAVTTYPKSADTMEDLINALEYTVSVAKDGKNGNICYCGPGMLDHVKRRFKVIDVLKDALTQGGFQVYYQPIWSVEKQCFTLAESLLRLPSTPLGPLYPSEFIPIAEETGLIVDITYYVLDTVCRFVHDLLDSGITMLESVTVNFSGVQFSQHNPAEKVISIIESHGIPYRMIKIEITESVLAESRQELEEFIDLMHAKGVEVSLDDFGTGYCNLVSVLSMDVDVIKLDKSLLWAAQKDQKTAIMMKSLARSVHELGMRVVSEGVETDEQRAFAEECCCDWIQGYYYAKPMPGEDAKRFLAERIEKS